MNKLPGILIAIIAASMFYFPVEFAFLPGLNTKNLLAVVGAVALLLSFVIRREFVMPKEIVVLLMLSCLVSVIAIISVTFNHTPEEAYTTYLISTLIWLLSAYGVCAAIRIVHGRLDFPLLINYMCAVCVLQCAVALMIRFIPAVQSFVDTYFAQGQDMLHRMHRLYGIGASLDIAGTRFACVLASIPVYMYINQGKLKPFRIFLLAMSFLFISAVGSIIARTTMVGTAMGLAYLGVILLRDVFSGEKSIKGKLSWTWVVAILIFIPVGVVLYLRNSEIRSLVRFGFEGFFNLVETGHFRTSSSDILINRMYVFPEETKTWLIGDGYFENSRNDINYLGDSTKLGFYMGTDVGYLRFIFLFGVPGLIAMMLVMLYATITAARSYTRYKWAYYLVFICGLIIWLKVSTDVFPFLALGIALGLLRDLVDHDDTVKEEQEAETEI